MSLPPPRKLPSPGPPISTTEQTFVPYIRSGIEGISSGTETWSLPQGVKCFRKEHTHAHAHTHRYTHTQSTMHFLPLQLTPSHTAFKVLLAGHLLWVAFLEPPKKLTFLLPSQPASLSRLARDPAMIYGLRLRRVWSPSIPLSILPTMLSTAPCEHQCSLNKSCTPDLLISV